MAAQLADARRIFLEAVENHAPEEWSRFLDENCQGDAELRARVEALLHAHGQYNSMLDGEKLVATLDVRVSERAGAQIGPYKLLQQIGEGGFGVVFMAEQLQPVRRKVALKVIKPGMDTRQVIARFEAERQALAVMDHPNIARVLDAGPTESGRPYFVMDLVRGVPITRYCDENNLPIRERLDLFVAVCQAIQHAHTKGIIHRDIKPSNVLVTRQDGRPVVKVIDFGVAKAMGQQLTDKTLFTQFAQMIGTPLYMSPEQAELSSVDIDTRSDIYSLGVLLYELLTGTTPVNREQLKQAAFDEVRRIIREEDPPKPSTRISTAEAAPAIAAHRHTEPGKLAKMMRGELDWIAMKCLEKDRNRRYETANALAADVQHYLDDQPVQACPPSAAYRFRKFARRYKAALATAAAIGVAMLLAVASLIATVKIQWDSSARIYAEQQQTKIALGRETQANKKLQVALATEREQRVRAEHNMKLTLRSLGLVYDRTYGPTENAPLSREQRKLSLEKEVALYEEFLRESSVDDSASLRVETASAYLRLGRLYLELERVADAEAAYRAAVQQLERLVQENPPPMEIRMELQTGYWWLGEVLRRLDRPAEAEQALRRSTALTEELIAESSEPPADQYRHLGVTGEVLSLVLNDLGRNKESRQLSQERVSRMQALDDSRLTAAQRQLLLADSYYWLGHGHLMNGRLNDAQPAFQQAVELWDQSASESPDVYNARRDLARGHLLIAAARERNAGAEVARQSFRDASELLESALADAPENPDRRLAVAFAYVNIGKLFMADPAWAQQVDEIHSRLMTIVAAVLADCPGSASHREVAGHQFRHWGCPLSDLRVHLPHAEEALREAAVAFEKCTVDFPNRAAGWHYAADSRRRLGLIYMGAGRLDEAEQELRSAIALHEQRAARFPVKPEFQLEWSLSNFDLGHFLSHHRHDDTAAIEAYQDALRVKPDLTAASERIASLQQKNSRPDKVLAEWWEDVRRDLRRVRAEAEEPTKETPAVSAPAPEKTKDTSEPPK